MEKTRLWKIQEGTEGLAATAVESLNSTQTEEMLEDLLVASPELLGDEVVLVGRQLPTMGGPLDLLGVDSDGRLVVYELKKGVLTRDAVAQVIDYASDIATYGAHRLARLIEEHSGQRGIEALEDFNDWYDQEFTNSDGPLDEAPRMVLVGLGVDDRARRMVEFLGSAGVEMSLLTFHAFTSSKELLLARQVEAAQHAATGPVSGSSSKQANLRVLHASAEALGVKGLLEEVAGFIDDRFPSYKWPGKTAYSFSLQERTSDGKPTLRSYVTLYLAQDGNKALNLSLAPRADDASPGSVAGFAEKVPGSKRRPNSWSCLEAEITPDNWAHVQTPLESLLNGIV